MKLCKLKIVDLQSLQAHVGGDMQIVTELVEIFEGYYPDQRSSLENAINGSDCVEVRELAHTLKGALSNFFAIKATNTARTLEYAGRDSEDNRFSELFVALDAQINELIAHLKSDLESK